MKNPCLRKIAIAVTIVLPGLNGWAQSGTPLSSYDDLIHILGGEYAPLLGLANMAVYGDFYLTNDITIPENTEWRPLGKPATWTGTNNNNLIEFRGTFDGNGYAIKGLTIGKNKDTSLPTAHYNFSAFFARLGFGAKIKNLGLEDVYINGRDVCGALAGVMYGNGTSISANANGVQIENVFVTGTIIGATEVGGIVGRSNNYPLNSIGNCYVNAEVTANGETTTTDPPNCAGSIVGCMNSGWNLLIENVYAAGSVTSTGYAGGLLGYVNNNNTNDHPFSLFIENSAVVVNEISGGKESGLFDCAGKLNISKISITDSYGRNDISGITGETCDPADFMKRDFYENTLGWDFNNVWNIEEGAGYPVFKKTVTKLANVEKNKCWNVYPAGAGIEVTACDPFFLSVYDITGKSVFADKVTGKVSIPLNRGIYILKGTGVVWKIIVK